MIRTDERYTTAITTDNLRMDTREHAAIGDVDVLTAAAWAPARLGSALLRLASEYGSAERPRISTAGDFINHAQSVLRSTEVTPTQQMIAQRAQQEADRANGQAITLLAMRLKTLPDVRRELTMQLKAWGHDKPEDAALAIVAWWLHRVCGKCEGRGYDVIPGTARLSAKACKACHGSGESRVPQGDAGRRLANHMDDCLSRARQSIKNRLRNTRA